MTFSEEGPANGPGSKSDLVGKVFGYLTPKSFRIMDGGYIWRCKCLCGTTKEVPARHLLMGDVKSCGCANLSIPEDGSGGSFGDLGLDFWSTIKSSALAANILFDISIEYAWILFLKQGGRCALTGRKLSFRASVHGNASLDRIDSTIGYKYGNVRWIYKDISLLKDKFDDSTLKEYCRKIFVSNNSGYKHAPINDSHVINGFPIEKHNYLSSDYYFLLKKAAKKSGLCFDITIDSIWKIYLAQGGRCSLSGEKIYFSRDRVKYEQTASVNRIDHLAGYTPDNIQIVHKDINIMKHTFSQDVFIRYASEIHNDECRDKTPYESIALSGGFDCAHKGHYRMFKDAKSLGLVVAILNSDEWLLRKKGYIFMPFEERREILESCRYIDVVVSVDDADDSVCSALKSVRPDFFGNGGDRKADNVPEVKLCNQLGIKMLWNIGGGKIQSSSSLVKKANIKAS